MQDPVIASDGYSYEREAIIEWLKTHQTSPMTGIVLLSKEITPNFNLKSQIKEYLEKKKIGK